MKEIEIVISGVYRAHENGEERKVLNWISGGHELKYEIVANPRLAKAMPVGSTNIVFTRNFAKWATERVG